MSVAKGIENETLLRPTQVIADVLKARGIEVLHIVDGDEVVPHPWSGAARLVEGRLDYAAPPDLFL